MKTLFSTIGIVFLLSCNSYSLLYSQDVSKPENLTQKVDTISEKKQAKIEKRQDIKEDAKELGQDVKEDLKQTGEDIKEEAKETWSKVKQSAKELLEEAEGFFNTKIKTNVVGKFSDERRQNNQDFCNYLRNDFEHFKIDLYSPYFPSENRLIDSLNKACIVSAGSRSLSPISSPTAIPEKEGELIQSDSKNIQFYGLNLKLDIDPKVSTYGIGAPKEANFAKFWQKLSESRFDIPLKQIVNFKAKYDLNDWGLYLLIKDVASKVYPKNKGGEQELWTVFMLNQAGYAAKIAKFNESKNSRLIVLLPVYERLYGIPVVEIEGSTFYIFEKFNTKERSLGLYTYQSLPTMSTSPMSLQITTPPTLSKLYDRKGNFTFDARLVEYYKTYPDVPTAVYKHAPFGEILYNSMQAVLKPALDSISLMDSTSLISTSEQEVLKQQIEYLRDFIAGYFKQEARPRNYSGTKALFPEEAFGYMAGNAKDKAILLSQLLKTFLGVNSVVLEYVDYALIGISVSTLEATLKLDQQEHFLMSDQQKYFLLDPSAKTSVWGLVPTSLLSKQPVVVE